MCPLLLSDSGCAGVSALQMKQGFSDTHQVNHRQTSLEPHRKSVATGLPFLPGLRCPFPAETHLSGSGTREAPPQPGPAGTGDRKEPGTVLLRADTAGQPGTQVQGSHHTTLPPRDIYQLPLGRAFRFSGHTSRDQSKPRETRETKPIKTTLQRLCKLKRCWNHSSKK